MKILDSIDDRVSFEMDEQSSDENSNKFFVSSLNN